MFLLSQRFTPLHSCYLLGFLLAHSCTTSNSSKKMQDIKSESIDILSEFFSTLTLFIKTSKQKTPKWKTSKRIWSKVKMSIWKKSKLKMSKVKKCRKQKCRKMLNSPPPPQNRKNFRENSSVLNTNSLSKTDRGGTLNRLLLHTTPRLKEPGEARRKSPSAITKPKAFPAPFCTRACAQKACPTPPSARL